ncbi:SurA N-terminal domain-containing protein [Acidovorax sp. IB03]|uniref:SurA N-terminal domain-containing protein n=1 Tax=Acidovorax TaxID=12916 RepID=UPI00082C3C0F|nr:SurA N-terminal domain-containing protein [Acidovorax sp. IB03]MBJ2165815.1 SurA N-terminal domain-containing protein [Acidovorax sp. IB03]
MFEAIRKHSKIVMFLLFLLVIPSFVLVGIDSNYFSEKSPVVARVDGHKITQADWDNAHREETDRIRAQSPNVDPKQLDTPQARYATLERLVRDRVFAAAAQSSHLITSDARLARALQDIPAIAALKRPDGSLDTEAYRSLVGAQGLTPEGFEANVRRELSVSQVMGGVMSTAFATDAAAKLAFDSLYQRREIQVARFNATDYAKQVNPTEADIEAFYKANAQRFQQQEQAAVEYVVLDLDSVRSGIRVNEDDLRTYYKENLTRLAAKEERRASHILINAAKDAPAADREQAKARAQELLAQVRKSPASFAEVAKKSSQDSGSAPAGGDLNFFGRGAMVKPFEDAVFAMKKGEISDVVESDFGYHIILLTDIKTPRQPSFEELRPSLEAELKQQQAQRKFAEVAEAFTNSVYEQPDSLKPVADSLKLKIQTAEGVTRVPGPGASGPLASPKFLEALFANDSVEGKRNTSAIEVGPSQLVAGRISTYTPTRTLALQEVSDRARLLLIAEKSAELARKDAEAKKAAWMGNAAPAAGLAPAVVVSRDQTQNLPRAVVDAALRASPDNLPAWVSADLGSQGTAVVKVLRIIPREGVDAQQAAQQRQQLQQWWSTAEGFAYYEMLKERFKVQIKPNRPQSSSI